jgi:hypothetical protein
VGCNQPSIYTVMMVNQKVEKQKTFDFKKRITNCQQKNNVHDKEN